MNSLSMADDPPRLKRKVMKLKDNSKSVEATLDLKTKSLDRPLKEKTEKVKRQLEADPTIGNSSKSRTVGKDRIIPSSKTHDKPKKALAPAPSISHDQPASPPKEKEKEKYKLSLTPNIEKSKIIRTNEKKENRDKVLNLRIGDSRSTHL